LSDEKPHFERDTFASLNTLVARYKTSNLSKAHVTRDNTGPVTSAISVGLHQ